jgi:hypothetical protein
MFFEGVLSLGHVTQYVFLSATLYPQSQFHCRWKIEVLHIIALFVNIIRPQRKAINSGKVAVCMYHTLIVESAEQRLESSTYRFNRSIGILDKSIGDDIIFRLGNY